CPGSCSWKVHVKDGIITWETQQTDYPTTGANMPEYEPQGCPRGASFSWYIYSPHRIRYPYIRRALLELWKREYEKAGDPVEAWKNIVENPEKAARYKRARGKGGFVRMDWDTAETIIAAQLIYTLREYGPDRIFGFSPIPAMSMVSYASGARFLNLLGAPLLSFYDWYADLPPASPQIWGEQTDVPESSDWYNSGYLLIWGSNLPQTRTPDAHFMVEARYRGTKVVAVSPDYAEFVKFADNWLAVSPGMDGALAMAMTHVILKEFYVKQQIPYFINYVKQFTDLPFLVVLKEQNNEVRSDTFLRANDIDDTVKLGEWKTVVWDENTKSLEIPNGSEGFRWDDSGKWNLDLTKNDGSQIDPQLSFLDEADEVVQVTFPYFAEEDGGVIKRGVPVKYIKDIHGNKLKVTTVYDLMMAHVGIDRGLPGDYPKDY
ncbi:MAG: molybdopterin-dependent oxidoreductase, partial [Bacillales bacterium]